MSRNNPKISVITASFNAAHTIEGALTSVLAQNYEDLEYIVIDGASSDGTMNIVEKYRDQLSHVVSEPDRGIYAAFNKGLRLATGDVIGILNADDEYAPWAFSSLLCAMRETPACSVWCGRIVVVEEETGCFYLPPRPRPSALPRIMSVAHPATFVRRGVYDRCGLFDESFRIAGDWDFLLRAYLAGEVFCTVEDVLVAYRNNGASANLSRRHVAEVGRIYRAYLGLAASIERMAVMELRYLYRKAISLPGLARLHATRQKRLWSEIGPYNGEVRAVWDIIRTQDHGVP